MKSLHADFFDVFRKKYHYRNSEKYKFMDQISQSNLTDKKLVECSSNKVSLETELSETLYNTMKDFVLSNPTWDQYKPVSYTHLRAHET